ncbi:MAG: hypothetical protein ACO2XZ_04090 [Rickettsiales bacterium]
MTPSSSGIYAWQKVAEVEKNLSKENDRDMQLLGRLQTLRRYLIECTLERLFVDGDLHGKNKNHYDKIVEFLKEYKLNNSYLDNLVSLTKCDETFVVSYLKQLVCELTLEEERLSQKLIMEDGNIKLYIFEYKPEQQGWVYLSYVFSDLDKKDQQNSLKDFLQNKDNRSILLAALKKKLEPNVAAPADEVLEESNHSYTSFPAPAPLPESAPVSWRTRLEQTFFACTPCAQR